MAQTHLALIFFISLAGFCKGYQNLTLIFTGEWGDDSPQQMQVANAMSSFATQHSPQAMVSCGDNIFPNGATSPTDPKFNTNWKTIYNLPGLSNLPWLIALGVVDYGTSGSGAEQNEIDHQDSDWICPDHYFDYVTSNGFVEFHVIVIDTVAIIDQTGDWDTMLNTWLPTTLQNSVSEFIVVVGYHPIYSAGEYGPVNTVLYNSLLPYLKQYGADAYISAQENNLQYMYENNHQQLMHLISGGGGGQPKTTINQNAANELSNTYGVTTAVFEPYEGFVALEENQSGGFSVLIEYITFGKINRIAHRLNKQK